MWVTEQKQGETFRERGNKGKLLARRKATPGLPVNLNSLPLGLVWFGIHISLLALILFTKPVVFTTSSVLHKTTQYLTLFAGAVSIKPVNSSPSTLVQVFLPFQVRKIVSPHPMTPTVP